MSWILHIETSTKVCSVALSYEGECRYVEEIADDHYAHGEQLTILIKKVIADAAMEMDELRAVSVACGPGSYTGLRIGMSTAKGLCYALDIPLILVDSLAALAGCASEKYPEQNLIPMIDARRMEVYAAVNGPQYSVLKSMSATILDETTFAEFEPFVFFGDGAEKVKELWSSRDCIYDATIRCSAAGQARLAYNLYDHNLFSDLAYSEPIYLKDFGGKAL